MSEILPSVDEKGRHPLNKQAREGALGPTTHKTYAVTRVPLTWMTPFANARRGTPPYRLALTRTGISRAPEPRIFAEQTTQAIAVDGRLDRVRSGFAGSHVQQF